MSRYVIVCEGKSEWTYLQRLKGFLDDQAVDQGAYLPALQLIGPYNAVAKGGRFGTLKQQYKATCKTERNKAGFIRIWADFDLYLRNDKNNATAYKSKGASGIPHFHFSFHNFEDFYALHLDDASFQRWIAFGQQSRSGRQSHFAWPFHSEEYLQEFRRIVPDYRKGEIPSDFVSWTSLNNLRRNKSSCPKGAILTSLPGAGCFAEFLTEKLCNSYPKEMP